MKQLSILFLVLLICAPSHAFGQGQSSAVTNSRSNAAGGEKSQTGQQRRPAPARQSGPGLTDYGIEIAPEARLVVMMAALDAAGWDPTPEGAEPSVFRRLIRKDLNSLDPALRARLQDFYKRYMLKDARATAADQAARYVSLAYALGPAPDFATPARSDDLPSGVIDVLDFAPLLREFYRQTSFAEKLPGYVNMYRAAGDGMRRAAIEAARSVLAYLNTRPETTVLERVQTSGGDEGGKKKKDEKSVKLLRERERRFVIVPDLLVAPGALNFRVIGDNYFAIVPASSEPRVSELRRAYLQYVFDPIVLRFVRDVALKRDAIKTLLDAERARKGRPVTPDVYLAVARSMVAAADARMDENARMRALQLETSERLKAADQAARDSILKDAKEREASIRDATIAQLAESYEGGAVLAFYFAEQLRGLEGSGFDVANFVPAMINDLNTERESRRPQEYAPVVERVVEARRRERESRATGASASSLPEKHAALIKNLSDVDALLRVRNYEEAHARLTTLKDDYRDEPRIYFALGQTASLSAQDAFDEDLQAERLRKALEHFRQAVLLATPDTERSIVLRAHLASGRILAHLERRDEALKEFDEVLRKAGEGDAAFQREAVAEKSKLNARP